MEASQVLMSTESADGTSFQRWEVVIGGLVYWKVLRISTLDVKVYRYAENCQHVVTS